MKRITVMAYATMELNERDDAYRDSNEEMEKNLKDTLAEDMGMEEIFNPSEIQYVVKVEDI